MIRSTHLFPPAITRLEGTLETMRREELDRHRKKMTPEEADLVARLTAGITSKLLDLVAFRLEAAYGRGEGETRLRVLQQLFEREKASVYQS
jgi:glutamyl-tRNA reductase